MDRIVNAVVGPVFVFILRTLMPQYLKKLPGWLQPVAAAVVSLAIAMFTGDDPTSAVQAVVDAIVVMLSSLGTVKGLDIVTGKSATVTAAEKEIVRNGN